MKIRTKLIITEITVSLILLTTILYSVYSISTLINYENMKIKTEQVRDHVVQMKYTLLGLESNRKPLEEIKRDFNLTRAKLTVNLEELISKEVLSQFDDSIFKIISKIESEWSRNRTTIEIKQIAAFLALRDVSASGRISTMTSTKLRLESSNSPDAVKKIEKIDEALSSLLFTSIEFSLFERILYSSLTDLFNAVDAHSKLSLIQVQSILATALAISIAIILFFSIRLGNKAIILDKALQVVCSGQLGIRVPYMGKDEFGDLGNHVNAFINTLQARTESFQTVMNEVALTIEDTINTERVESILLKLAMKDTNADGAALYRIGFENKDLIISSMEGKFRPLFPVRENDLPDNPDEADIAAIIASRWLPMGKTVLGECAQKATASLCNDVKNSLIKWQQGEDNALFVSSYMVVPLQIGKSVIGVLAITSSTSDKLFSPLEYINMQSFGHLAAITLDNIYRYGKLLETSQLNMELDIASNIQQNLIPSQLPRLDSGEAAYMSRRIQGLNGDYFDVRNLGDGQSLLVICELTGRGVPAGLMMVMIRTLILLFMSPEKDAAIIVNDLNYNLSQNLSVKYYASLSVMIIDKSGHFSFIAGSNKPLNILRRDSGTYEQIFTEGLPVGIDASAKYEQKTGQLKPDDLVVLFSDGIPESQNVQGRSLGAETVLEAIKQWSDMNPDIIASSLKKFIKEFEENVSQQDDQTALIYKYKSEALK